MQSSAPNYPRTRRRGSWMRHQPPCAVGLRRPSRRDFGPDASDVCVLYAAAGSPAPLAPSGQEPLHLDAAAGRGYVNLRQRAPGPVCGSAWNSPAPAPASDRTAAAGSAQRVRNSIPTEAAPTARILTCLSVVVRGSVEA